MENAENYAALSKNTVDAKNQLKTSDYVFFENPEGKGKRFLFVGNSMILHGIREEIGWHGLWGMAASAKEKDYVHIIMRKIRETDSDAAFCICQVSEWECNYKNGSGIFDSFEAARAFDADCIIMRFVENCKKADFDSPVFKDEMDKLLSYLNPSGEAKPIMTTGFWRHPGDEAIRAYAEEHNLPLAELGDLGDDDKMKAIGLFAHSGVANHPGDLGMEMMAMRILEKV